MSREQIRPPNRCLNCTYRILLPPILCLTKRVSGRLTQVTWNAPIPTWGQIKTLCHQARGMTSLQGSPTSSEKMFIAMLALLSCQISASSPTPEKYWAYFPDPPTFQVVNWNSDPLSVHTNQPQLLGGLYTSYITDEYLINFNLTFRGLVDNLPVYFNFPNNIESFVTPPKEGCVGASKKAILTHSPASSIEHRGRLAVWMFQAHMPGALNPHKTVFHRPPLDIQVVIIPSLQIPYGTP